MKRYRGIVESNIEPSTDVIWNYKGQLKYFNNGKWRDLTNKNGGSSIGELVTSITYNELKELRNNNSLEAGHLYRITDYEFTTKQVETKSAGHVFDIIVLAVAENELSHQARAIQHEGDTYFEGNDLGAWELWYELDNDAEKYAWADAENGKGIIYRMIDEKRNDCPYDFKNALFYKRGYSYSPDGFYYTFSFSRNSVLEDASIKDVRGMTYRFCNNKIGVYCSTTGRRLNHNIFINTGKSGIQHNTVAEDCFNNLFTGETISNELRFYCSYNTIYEGYGNVLGPRCQRNTLGEGCQNNIFDEASSGCSLGAESCYNLLKTGNASINIGNYCCYNSIETNFHPISMGASCDNNIIIKPDRDISLPPNTKNYTLRNDDTSITNLEEYFDDGSGQLVPIKHPDLSTQPSILPYKFMGQYVYEQLIPKSELAQDLAADFFEASHDKILFLEVTPVTSSTENSKVYSFNIAHDGKYLLTADGMPSSGFSFPYLRVVYTSMPEDGGYYYGGDELQLPTTGVLIRCDVELPADFSHFIEMGGMAKKFENIGGGYHHLDIIPSNFTSDSIEVFGVDQNDETLKLGNYVTNVKNLNNGLEGSVTSFGSVTVDLDKSTELNTIVLS